MPRSAHDYASVISPEPWQILGVQLKPLSLHHCLLMQRFNVAFVSHKEQPVTEADVVTGILICSRHWEDGEFEQWAHTKKARIHIAKWGAKVGQSNLLEKANLFKQYVDEHSEEPAFWQTSQVGGRSTGANWIQCVLLVLTGQCNYSRQEALRAPLPQALSDYFRYAETQGAVQLATEIEAQQMKAMEAQEAKP